MAHVFLTEEWLDAVEELRDEHADDLPDVPIETSVNVTVRSAPFTPDDICLHIDTAGGYPILIREHVDPAELTVTIDYATAVDLFVAREPEKMVAAFFEGRILVQGDVTQLMALQGAVVPSDIEATAAELAEKIGELTIFPEADS